MQTSRNKLVRAVYGTARTNSARPIINPLKIFIVKYVYNHLVRIYIYKSISKLENNFVRYESLNNPRQTLNQVQKVLLAYSTQTIQSFTYSGPRIFNSVPVNIKKCQTLGYLQIQLKAHILFNNVLNFNILQ